MICPNCKRDLATPYQVHNCMRKKRTDAGKPRPKPQKPLRRYEISYAYDIPFYTEFVIEAKNQREAMRIAKEKLAAGVLEKLAAEAQPCYENQNNDRVFFQGIATDTDETLDETLARLGKRP